MHKERSSQQAVQFIGITPEEVNKPVLEILQEGFEKLQKQFQPKEPTEYLTRNEVKKLLNVNLSTIWSWQKKGKLKAYGIGHRVYFKRHEVKAAIKPLNML